MKTRNQIYRGEGAELLRLITTYHALLYDQILQFFPRNRESIKSLITSLVKQGRIFYNPVSNILSDLPEVLPDSHVIAAFWVLLDFKDTLNFHTNGEFPILIHFFSKDESYEIIYAEQGQEFLLNHVFESLPVRDSNRLMILESESQAAKLCIEGVRAFCFTDASGAVSYYQKK